MPFIAPAVGIGVFSLLQKPRARFFMTGFLLYAFLFQVAALWAQFALFTGCATKGADTRYAFPSSAFCLDQTALLIDRIAVLGWPVLAVAGFGGASICALVLLFKEGAIRGKMRQN